MGKSPAHISLLAFLLGSEPHREALLKVLTAAQIPKETALERIEETISSIFSNDISFSDDELPSEGWAHSRALHIVCKCNNFIIGRVMIDNGSALNVCPETAVPYISIGDDQNLPFHSFETISVIQDYGEIGPTRADRIVGKVLLRHNYIPGTELGAHGQGINRPIEVEEYKNRRGLGFRPSCHEIIEARRGKHLHRLAARYGKINRGILAQPLSYFFPGPPHIVGEILDGPSSDSDSEPVDLPNICAVTEVTTPGAYIRLAQENEELNNWTSVSRYSVHLQMWSGDDEPSMESLMARHIAKDYTDWRTPSNFSWQEQQATKSNSYRYKPQQWFPLQEEPSRFSKMTCLVFMPSQISQYYDVSMEVTTPTEARKFINLVMLHDSKRHHSTN
ncbi:hypothetical protein CRG98_038160 [Punica granatum]|uniref:G-patch domain-containing protein n=1 Tax=Punica granatum TaxID=22663 RepID=A0A2I0IBS6_PUNGR|nr:hypothetical protein CRG98_038160 [Punica granatum]